MRKSVYLGMAIMLFSAPLLACTLPGLTMSQAEQECCRQMADQCGNSQMQDSHSCCTQSPTANSASQPAVKFSAPLAELVIHVPARPALPELALLSASLDPTADRSSKSPPGHTSVLRI